MGSVDLVFATDLRDQLGLTRAVETGTYRGITARALAGVFPAVVTIELSKELHSSASAALAGFPHIKAVQGHSVDRLRELAEHPNGTLYFLDGHWSAGITEGAEDECPVVDEMRAIGSGHADDCLIVDDARLFTSSPPPPHDPTQWPTIVEVFDAMRELRPEHIVTVLDDQVVAVPARARSAIDRYGLLLQKVSPLRARANAVAEELRVRLGR